MKQIEYTEKQKLILEILEKFDEFFKPKDSAYVLQRKEYFEKVQKIKKFYGIKEKYLTLREYINKKSCGAYHRFFFSIGTLKIANIYSVEEFEQYYNSKILDNYFVLNDITEEHGLHSVNYTCDHHLELVEKD